MVAAGRMPCGSARRSQIIRANARGPDGLDGKSRAHPRSRSPARTGEVVEAGPVPAVDGVRWRRKDLARWLLETFAISLDETTVKALGFAKIEAELSRLLKRFPDHERRRDRAVRQDEAHRPEEFTRMGHVARARGRPATSANGPISAAICPAKGKGAGLVSPGATPTPWRRTSSRSVPPSIGADMRCDRRSGGWHDAQAGDPRQHRRPGAAATMLNPVENVWQFMNRISNPTKTSVALKPNNLIEDHVPRNGRMF